MSNRGVSIRVHGVALRHVHDPAFIGKVRRACAPFSASLSFLLPLSSPASRRCAHEIRRPLFSSQPCAPQLRLTAVCLIIPWQARAGIRAGGGSSEQSSARTTAVRQLCAETTPHGSSSARGARQPAVEGRISGSRSRYARECVVVGAEWQVVRRRCRSRARSNRLRVSCDVSRLSIC